MNVTIDGASRKNSVGLDTLPIVAQDPSKPRMHNLRRIVHGICSPRKMRSERLIAERGFAVVEVLVALLITIAVGFVTVFALKTFSRAVFARSFSEGGTVALEQQIESMRADSASAFAVFVPQVDVFRAFNAAAPSAKNMPTGHEVDFYSRTDAGTEAWWAYTYEQQNRTLRRYDYDSGGNVGVADSSTGIINTKQRYPALTGVTGFSARVLQAGQLSGSGSEFGPLIAQLTNSAVTSVKAEPVGFVPLSGSVRKDLFGGNVTVEIRVATDRGARTIHLLSAALPSGFIINQVPAIRAVTYRIDIVHRFWFGFAQITHSQIFNQLLYSYDPTAPPKTWKVWCDWELYGSKIAGLRVGDPNAAYQPKNYSESAVGIYDAVIDTGPSGNGTTGLNEQPGCHQPVPGPTSTAQTSMPQPDPDTNDTAPPCFPQGGCWPMGAPPNFTPPSPWPSSPPPLYWCATHQESPLCGGAGGTPTPIYGSPPPVNVSSPAPQLSLPPVERRPQPPSNASNQ